MRNFLTKVWSTGIVNTFLAGLLVILPVSLTVVVLNWIGGKFSSVLGPGSMIGDLIASGGGTLVGSRQTTIAYITGLLLAAAVIWLIGIVVRIQAKREIDQGVDRLFERLPLVRSIYKPIAQVVRLFGSSSEADLKKMSVIVCRFNGIDVLGLATSATLYDILGDKRRLVYLPTSPIPMSGGLVLVSENRITSMPDISVDELLKLYFSLGVVAPDAVVKAAADRVHSASGLKL